MNKARKMWGELEGFETLMSWIIPQQDNSRVRES